MRDKLKAILEAIDGKLAKYTENGKEKSEWMHLMELVVSAITLTTYCAISPILAEYQGKKLIYWTAVCAIVFFAVLAGRELFCLIGYETVKKFFGGIYKILKGAVKLVLKCCCSSQIIYILPAVVIIAACVILARWQFHTTKYYSSIVEIYGIPTGVGDPLSSEERKYCADYWKIQDYPFYKKMIVTHEDAYHEDEIMEQYSSIYSMVFFQPVDHMVYRYKKNKDKFQDIGEEAYLTADKYGFRYPTEITYFNSSGKLLLEMKKGEESDTYDILTYSVDSMPQLFQSTLLRIPEEDETDGIRSETDKDKAEERPEKIARNAIETSIKSQEIEVIYNADGLPEMRRINPRIYNLYGVNGERYEYNENNQMIALYYLDVNGEPICNQKGIMMVSFEYGERNRLTGVRYFSDENGEERTEGFQGVFCEKLEYDSNGNLCGRKQLNQSENRWYDKNGVCEYRYTYDEGRLIREVFLDFSGNEAYNENVKSTWLEFAGEWDSAGNKMITISLDPIIRLAQRTNTALLEKAESKESKEQNAVPVMSDHVNSDNQDGEEDTDRQGEKQEQASGIDGDAMNNVENGRNNKYASEAGAASNAAGGTFPTNNQGGADLNTVQVDKPEEETQVRNYTKVCYAVHKNDRLLHVSYYNGDDRVSNEAGVSGEELKYDEKLRIAEKIYLDAGDKQCQTVDGYARVVFNYTSENGDEKKRIEYKDTDDHLAMNKKEEYGYAAIEYKPFEEEEIRDGESTITLEYHDQNDELLRLSEKGYAKIRQTYNERGLLVREIYQNEDKNGEVPAYRKDYMVARIDYEYSDDGNLICETYKDASGNPVNRYDIGAAMRFQEFENGKRVKIHYKGYKDNILQDVPNKKSGIGIICYIYANGRKTEEQYYDIKGTPVLRNDCGFSVQKIEYNNQGLIAAQRFYGTDGKLILRKDAGYAVVKYQHDELGREEFCYFYGVDEESIVSTYYYCAGMQYQYDEMGNKSDILYLDENNNLMMRRDYGYAWINRKYNQDGQIVEQRYFDSDGRLAESREGGYAVYLSEYEDKKQKKVTYEDKEAKPTLHKEEGYATVEYEYDDQGRCIKEMMSGTDGKAIISKKYNCAGFGHAYKEGDGQEGDQEITRYLDVDGNPMIRKDRGFVKVCKTYDDFGRLTGEEYYDADSTVMLHAERGYASFKDEYDEKGNCVRNVYMNEEGNLTLRKDTGCAVTEHEYDDFGRCIRDSYYGTDYHMDCSVGNDENKTALVYHAEYGCAGVRYWYDEAGNVTDVCYTNTDGNVMTRRDLGYARGHWEYDARGNLTGAYFYDVNNNPTTCKDGGYASFKKKYENDKCTEALYYDTKGDLVLRNDQGFAMERWQYDAFGQCVSDAFFDTEGRPIINKKYQCAAFEYGYDSRGYQTDVWYKNTDGQIMIRPDLGCAHVKKEYDNRGNQVKGFYYDMEDRLTLAKDSGIAYFEDDFDERDNLVEKRCYGKNRELKLRKDEGYAVGKWFYDSYGRCEKIEYYQTDGETRVFNTKYHCAGFQYEYDGDTEITAYLGLDGKIMIREDLGYAKQIVETIYDSETNRTIKRGYYRDADGRPAARAKGGYTGYEDIYIYGKLEESRCFMGETEQDWELMERADQGYAILKKDFDPFGQCISEFYLDAEEQPVYCLEKETKICAQYVYDYDEKGNRISIIYKDTSGDMMIRDNYGYAKVCIVYDEQGNEIENCYYDTEEQPVALQGDYFSVDWFYQNGNCTETRYYDAEKRLMAHSDENYAMQKDKYDAFGQCIWSSYYDTDGALITNTRYGCATFEYRYDHLGNKTDIIYRDTSGDMTVRESLGYAWIHRKYDEWNRLEEESYYDAAGNPTKDVDGRAGFKYVYDEQGKEKGTPYDLYGNEIN